MEELLVPARVTRRSTGGGQVTDHKYRHGQLVERDVARCREQSVRMLASGQFGSHFFSAFATAAKMRAQM
ncbi:hypothetical protein KIN20_034091 [Parelaphostrongylus tenuis]|uniref:Uncharacterized protein n=1 Tax=Parelaphostrongylus tenuis TaxID=148309 RepID=A0AAD5WIS5_PARTN|nr:hypothetical protein KIN20_034091 [Parelaphostrongylus tenuis]